VRQFDFLAVDLGLSHRPPGSIYACDKDGENEMAYATGEVVANPDKNNADGHPFLVVFKHGDEVIGSWPVASKQEGEDQIRRTLRGLKDIAKKEGFIK
jgi:hypothetical protein